MAEVQEFPRNPNDSLVPITWAEGGNATEPSSGRKLTGWQSNDTVSEDEINWLSQEPMRAIRALQSRAPLASDGLFSSWLARNGIWADGNDPLEGFLTDSGLTDSLVSDVWCDPSGSGAVRMQVSVSLGSPHTFTANKTTYISVPVDVTTPPMVTEPELLYTELPLGDPPPLVTIGYVHVWRVDTDASSITDQEILVPTSPLLNNIYVQSLGIIGDLSVVGALEVRGSTDLAALACTTINTTGNVSCGGNLDMTNGAISNALTISASSTTTTISATSSHAANSAIDAVNSSSGNGISGSSVSGTGGVFVGGGSGKGASCIGGTTGQGVAGLGGATSGAGVAGTSQGGASPGVLGTGANAIGCHGVAGVAANTSAYGVSGTTAAAATTSAAGVRGDGLGDGVAISGVAVNGNALRVESDTTSPTRAPILVVGQDIDPSTTQAGGLAFQTTRAKFRFHTGSKFESFHSSQKGFLHGTSSASTSSNATTSGDIGDVTIVPEEAGDVLITVTGFWKGSTDTTYMTVLLKDITGSATILTTQQMSAPDRDADGQDRTLPFTVRYFYTLPSAVSRLFRYRLNVTATTNWYDVFMTVDGVF